MSPPATARTGLLAASLVGLLVRLAVLFLLPIAPAKDAAEYHGLAARLAAGRGYVRPDGTPTAFRPPGHPVLLASVYRLSGPEPMAGRILLALVGSLAVPLVGLLAQEVAGPAASRWAAWLAALYPPFVSSWYGPRSLLSEVTLTTLCLLALWLAVAARESRRPVLLALAAGAVAGAASLTKATVLCLPLLLMLYLNLDTSTLLRCWRTALAVVVGTLAVMAPWMLRNHALYRAWVPVSTNGGISVWASYNPSSRGLGGGREGGYWAAVAEDERLRAQGLDEVERSRHFLARTWREIGARPGRAARLILRKVLLFWDPSTKDWSEPRPRLRYNWAYGMVLPPALVGALLALRHGEARRTAALLAAFALTLAAVHILLHTDIRYRVTLEPVLVVFAAVALQHALGRLGRTRMLAAAVAYAGLHALIAWNYDVVFAVLSRAVRAVGLG